MHEIIFYEDAAGNKPVLEFIQELRRKNGKDARIRLNKVLEYIKVLETSGTAAGEPYTKHLDGDIYELRPISDRIFFAAVVGRRFRLIGTPAQNLKNKAPAFCRCFVFAFVRGNLLIYWILLEKSCARTVSGAGAEHNKE